MEINYSLVALQPHIVMHITTQQISRLKRQTDWIKKARLVFADSFMSSQKHIAGSSGKASLKLTTFYMETTQDLCKILKIYSNTHIKQYSMRAGLHQTSCIKWKLHPNCDLQKDTTKKQNRKFSDILERWHAIPDRYVVMVIVMVSKILWLTILLEGWYGSAVWSSG